MRQLNRRMFLGKSAACAVLASAVSPVSGFAAAEEKQEKRHQRVFFVLDGLPLLASEYAELLGKLVQNDSARDFYLGGGCVAELEGRFAKLLGKERALFLPTGTLANHLALRIQAGQGARVLVQAESHIYRDSLDCVQRLSHLNLVPVGAQKATVPLEEIEEACRRAADKPAPLQTGVISLECPVRRMSGVPFDLGEMKRITAFARKHNIKMHLDGARLWIASAYTSVSVMDYANLFDTVYVSLYKCFNAGAGAILAGPRATIELVAQARKLFGGDLFEGWPYAAVALHYLDGFVSRHCNAVELSRTLFTTLEKDPRFRVEFIPNGTNIVRLHLKDIDAPHYRESLLERGVVLDEPSKDYSGFDLTINESLNRWSADDLAEAFVDAVPK